MSDEDYDFEGDVSLDVDEKNVGGAKQDWLKFAQKGQIVRAAIVYFYTVDANAVSAAMKAAKKGGTVLSKEQIQETAKKAIAARATELNKTVDQLTPTDRLDIKVAHFKNMRAHYQEGFGYALSRLGKDGAEADLIWKRLPEAKVYFTTLLLIYPADSEGNLNKEQFVAEAKNNSIKLLPWRFSSGMYDKIWKQNASMRSNNLSLAGQDIKLECKESQFQNIDISVDGAAVWQKNENIKQQVLTKALAMYDKLVPFREMSTDQLKAKLGLGGSAVSDTSTDNFAEMLDQV
jgi:hypothetical protein